MERLRDVLAVLACLAIIAQSAVSTGLAGATAAFAADNMSPILAKIVNTSAEPIPVVGTVQAQIQNLPTDTNGNVKVHEQGTAKVDATNLNTDTSGNLKVAAQGTTNVNATNLSTDANGNLKVASQGTADVNATNLPTDANGNLKVASQGTADVNATNLPTDASGNLKVASQGTTNVNVTNPSLLSQPSVATKFVTKTLYVKAGDYGIWNFAQTINASSITVSLNNDNAEVSFFSLDNSAERLRVGTLYDSLTGIYSIPLPQRVPLDSFQVYCHNAVEDCEVDVTVVGD